ncbi:hypothetical protein HanRHA438_Chr10g0459371 [Helianthus annuus]|nr:hypothetical protein HanRHA438_Chr10g0459371 [Helianthus annuus]
MSDLHCSRTVLVRVSSHRRKVDQRWVGFVLAGRRWWLPAVDLGFGAAIVDGFSGFQICLDERSHYGLVYKGWVDKTTYTPFKDNTGLPIVVKKLPYNHVSPETLS